MSEIILSWAPAAVFFLGLVVGFILIQGVRNAVDSIGCKLSLLEGKLASGKDMESVKKSVGEMKVEFSTLLKDVGSTTKDMSDSFAGSGASLQRMEDSIGGIRDYLAEKGNEAQRLQEGHDYAVMKNFCKQVIRCIHQIEVAKEGAEAKAAATLNGIRLDLVDLLDRNGIEEFSPDVGQDYAEYRAFAEVSPQKEFTNDKSQVGRIAEVLRSGFRYVYNNDQVRLIVPAQVKVYAGKR